MKQFIQQVWSSFLGRIVFCGLVLGYAPFALVSCAYDALTK